LRRAHLRRATQQLFACAAVLGVAVVGGCGGGSTNSNPAPISIAVSVTLSSATASVQAGQTQAFTASVANDSANKGVTWALSGAGCGGATCGTLSATSSASGMSITYTAPASVPNPASVTLTATSVADGTKTATAVITITAAPVPAIGVTLSQTTANVVANNSLVLSATVTNDFQNKGVTWSLTGMGCSGGSCGTIVPSASGSGASVTYTAPPNVPNPPLVTLTATSVADPTKSAAAAITVVAPITISLSQTAVSVMVNATTSFSATVVNDSAKKGVSWTLFTGSGTACPTACGTVTPATSLSGAAVTYTAPATVPTPALVDLVATSVSDPTKTAAAGITVTSQALPITVSISPTTAPVDVGAQASFKATVANDSQNKGVTWTVSGTGTECNGNACGTVTPTTSASGAGVQYTAPVVVPSPATVTLTATSVADPTKTATATVTVDPSGAPISVAIAPKRGGLVVGQSLNFTATVTNDVAGAGVTWSASSGAFSAQTTTTTTYTAPNSPGPITVTATSVAAPTQSASATLGITDLAGVTTYHNDLSRDGANEQEYALNTSNVATATFGKLFSCTVDGAVYAQPLWVPNVSLGGGTHNVIVVATQRDWVYVFDADASPCTTYWKTQFIPSGETYGNNSELQTDDIYPDLGITGTPVIDTSSSPPTIYLVTKTKNSGTTNYHSRLHALSLTTGDEAANSPVTIGASVTGNCDGGSTVSLDPMRQNQRPGLALVNGVVYVGYGSHGDEGNWHGWLLGYQTSNLKQVSAFNTTPNALASPLGNGAPPCGGGIWMSGGAPAADASNNLFVTTGNGAYDGTKDFGDSYLKLSTPGLSVLDSFTPSNQASLDTGDVDVGSSGTALLIDQTSGPVAHLMMGASKAGVFFLLNRDSLGGFHSSDQVVQEFTLDPNSDGVSYSTPAFWNNNAYFFGTPLPGAGGTVSGQSYAFASGKFNTTPTRTQPQFGFPGATPSISASSTTTDGIVWMIDTEAYGTSDSGSSAAGPAVLHAFDANNISTELWNSAQASGGRDTAGNAVKFAVPTVANGKVYIGTRGNDDTLGDGTTFGELDVYGLLPN
jgi:hypothetical protein